MAKLSALVIDDNKLSLRLLTDILEEKKVQVFSYSDPTEFLQHHAVTCCTNDKPCFDLILTDNKMAHMNGTTFLKRIDDIGCQIAKHQTAIISGDWDDEELQKAEQLGCHIFCKPCPIEEIFSWVDEISANTR